MTIKTNECVSAHSIEEKAIQRCQTVANAYAFEMQHRPERRAGAIAVLNLLKEMPRVGDADLAAPFPEDSSEPDPVDQAISFLNELCDEAEASSNFSGDETIAVLREAGAVLAGFRTPQNGAAPAPSNREFQREET